MRQRLISAAVLVPVVVIVFVLGDPWLTLFITMLAAAAAWETARLVRLAGLGSEPWLAMLFAGLAVLGLSGLAGRSSLYPAAFAAFAYTAAVVGVSAVVAFRQREPRDGFLDWVGTIVASLYPGLLAFMAGVLFVAQDLGADTPFAKLLDPGRSWLLVLVLTVWSLDSFALLAGKYHGRGRFMNHISPNKTWSGAIGGTVAAVVVCAVLTVLLGESALFGALLGLGIAVAAQAGDLTESMLKRAAGAKDSGTLIPGHGGFLDRLDSFLFASPVMFAALVWLHSQPLHNVILQ